MSVRRLAEQQPASFDFTPENLAWANAQIAKYPEGRQASAVIPLLWQAQKQHDYWLPKPAIEYVGRMLDMPYIRVLEVATFYTMFNLEPVGKYFIQVCTTSPCGICGAEDVVKALLTHTGAGELGQTSPDGKFTVIEVECLGACGFATPIMINEEFVESVSADKVPEVLARLT